MITKKEQFKYINLESNDLLGKLKSDEIKELLDNINNYYLSMRFFIGLNEEDTFGTEIEFEDTILNAMTDTLISGLQNLSLLNSWRLKYDSSLISGGEITSPILVDTKETWENLEKICYLIGANASIGHNSAGHIHVGAHILGDKYESWLNFIKLWSVYEKVIFRFSYGEFLTPRETLITYAKPISIILNSDYNEFKQNNETKVKNIKVKISHERFQAVNFMHAMDFYDIKAKNTIEFRCPNGTLDPVIWQNNINLFVKLLKYSKSDKYDDDKISKRQIINSDKYNNMNLYKQIYLTDAIELSDMIFDNNLDKIYFLRQYIKSFDIGNKAFEKAKQFTKTRRPKKPLC